MLEYVTAGQSHGSALYAIVTGFPAGLRVDKKALDAWDRVLNLDPNNRRVAKRLRYVKRQRTN